MDVKKILDKKGHAVITATETDGVSEVANTLWTKKIGALVISNDSVHVDGIISERDIVHGVAEFGPSFLEQDVRSAMTRDVITCSLNEQIDDVMTKMSTNRMRHLPCVEEGRLEGMISIGDVLQHKLEEMEDEAEAMRAYIHAR